MSRKRQRSQDGESSLQKKHHRIEDSDSEEDDVIESSLRVPSTMGAAAKMKVTHNSSDPVAGVVKRISMNNFMCHNRLEVVLGRHVNFIVGRNGSGKSAVVTALVVGLGGKASTTSRGSSIKNFVKTGKRSAWVEVVLNNKGKDSYKPHVYGEKIVITRKFSAEGSSSYSIKSDKGVFVSSRRDELARITDHLNIQVENPVSILNQDTSRNFLNSKSAADKFKFFMKATQLDQMSADYENVNRSKEMSKQIITEKEQTLPKMKSEVREWETKFKNMTAISDLKKKVKHLKHEMAWALVNQKEKRLKPMEQSLKLEVEALPRFEKKVEDSKEHLDSWEARQKELQEQMIESGKEVQELEPLLQEKKKIFQKAKDQLQPIAMDLKSCERELIIANKDCRDCQERIDELRTMATHDHEKERAQREETLAKYNDELNNQQRQWTVKNNDLDQFRSAIAKSKTEIAALEKKHREFDQQIKQLQKYITQLANAKKDKLQKYGASMPDVLRLIGQRKKEFHRVPIGPLGANFDLVQHKWALAVEQCLKGLVTAFACHDFHDQRILEQIFQMTRTPKPTIIVSKFTDVPHNVRATRVQSDRYICMLDVIKSNNPMVLNTLIDQRAVENVIVIEDNQEARNVMIGSNPPRNSRECFTVEGDQMFSQPTFRLYSAPMNAQVRYLMADAESHIRNLQAEMKSKSDDDREIQNQIERHHHEMSENQKQEKMCYTQLNKIKEKKARIQFDMNELQQVEEAVPMDVSTLEEEVANFQIKIKELKEKKTTILANKSEAERSLQQAREGYKQVEASMREKSDSGVPLREEISQAHAEVDKAKNEKKHYAVKLKEQERKIQELESDIKKYKVDLEADKEKATQICPYIATKRTDTSIENEIRQIQARVEQEEQVHGNEKEIIETYEEKRRTYDKVQQEVRQLKNYLQRLDEVMKRRQHAYLAMRKDIASRTKYYFIVQLHQRNFMGKMNFDFDHGTLDILVNPGSEETGMGKAKDLKSLSGGERSFSTVCFILSLWEAMEAPFRCLDEFDVFMDMVNRRVSMEMMLETADLHKDMQFVFLTPQDMRSIRKLDDVKIFRMPDPERSETQKMLNFSQQQ